MLGITDLVKDFGPESYKPIKPVQFNPNYAKTGKEIYYPVYVEKVRKILSENKIFTVQEVVNKLRPEITTREDILKGKIYNTIFYLEYEGFVCFLPDINKELTFCNYKYFKTL